MAKREERIYYRMDADKKEKIAAHLKENESNMSALLTEMFDKYIKKHKL